jgi:hypothetical protein
MTIDATMLALPNANDWPLQPDPHPSPRQQISDLTDDEFAAANAAVEQLRLRKAEQEAMRQRWQPCVDELVEVDDDEDGDAAMARHFLAMCALCGWNIDDDYDDSKDRLTRLVVGTIGQAELPVSIVRRRGRPDQVNINGKLVPVEA